MKKPPIGTPPREASEQRLAEEQAKREPQIAELRAEIERLQAALRKKDENLTAALVAANTEMKRLWTALRDTKQALLDDRLDAGRALVAGIAVVDAALSGKGET